MNLVAVKVTNTCLRVIWLQLSALGTFKWRSLDSSLWLNAILIRANSLHDSAWHLSKMTSLPELLLDWGHSLWGSSSWLLEFP